MLEENSKQIINYTDMKNILEKANPSLFNTVGIIVDATSPYKSLDSYDYLTKVKIIDNHINHENKKNKFDYIQVFIYHKQINQGPKISNIGDYISLRKFKFEESKKNKNELYAKYDPYNSEWVIIDGTDFNKVKKTNLSDFSSNKNFKNRNVFKYIENNLIKFRQSHFQKNSITNMVWFNRSIPKNIEKENSIIEFFDIDILVKILEIKNFMVYDTKYYKIIFADKEKNIYYSEYKQIDQTLEKGDCLKLRSIKIYYKTDEKKIEFRSYSKILKLLNFSKDYKELNEKTKSINNKTDLELVYLEELHLDKLKSKKVVDNVNIFYYEEDNNLPFIKNKFCSSVKNDHNNLKIVDKDFDKELKSKKSILRIVSKIGKLENNSFEKSFKLFSKSKNCFYEIKEYNKVKSKVKDLVIAIQNSFKINNHVIAINSIDGNPSYLFDNLVKLPNYNDVNSWVKLDSKVIAQINSTLKNFGKNKEYEIVIKKNGNVWELKDTILTK